MVGVPRRSGGCHTCRRRKKKCDLQRPICGNCMRGQFVCAGYDRDMIMIQVDQKGKGTYQARQHRKTIEEWSKVTPCIPSLADVRLRDLNRTTLELECLAGYRDAWTPELNSNELYSSRETQPPFLHGWCSLAFSQPQRSELVRCSLVAVSAFYVGHMRGDKALRTKGIELFGDAVHLLRKAVDPSRPTTVNEEVAGYVVSTFEYLRQELPNNQLHNGGTDRFRKYYDKDEMRFKSRTKGYLDGIVTLFQLHDPEAYSEPTRHHVFVQLRMIYIPQCIEKRKRTFLESSRWVTGPWKGLAKTYCDTVFDIMTPIPGMLEDWDSLIVAPPGQSASEQAAALRSLCRRIHIGFHQWHNELSTACQSISEPTRRSLRKHIQNLAIEDLPSILVEHDKWYLLSWTMYWASCIIFYGIVSLIYLRFPPTQAEPVIVAPDSIGSYCLSIARSVEYFVKPGQCALLVEAMIRAPVQVVQGALANPFLRATRDPKLLEAEDILSLVGKEGPSVG